MIQIFLELDQAQIDRSRDARNWGSYTSPCNRIYHEKCVYKTKRFNTNRIPPMVAVGTQKKNKKKTLGNFFFLGIFFLVLKAKREFD